MMQDNNTGLLPPLGLNKARSQTLRELYLKRHTRSLKVRSR